MLINFGILGQENFEPTVESIKQFENVSAVTIVKDPSNLNYVLSKTGDLLVLCDAGDTFSEHYLQKCLELLQDNPIVGAIYTNVMLNNKKWFIPSFCRQTIVRNKVIYPINCVIKQNLLPTDFFKYGNSIELFRKFSNKYMMYHCSDFLVNKEKLIWPNVDNLEKLCEYSDTTW